MRMFSYLQNYVNLSQRKPLSERFSKNLFVLVCLGVFLFVGGGVGNAQTGTLVVPRLQYGGGGDWYTDPTSMPNLLKAAAEKLNIVTRPDHLVIKVGDAELFSYPMMYLTGHGNVKFDETEINRLVTYLDNGGFLWVDDCYGIDRSIRRELKKMYPDLQLVPIPADHPIFHTVFDFPKGLPKIHEHDGKPPAAYGIFNKGRLIVFYTFETDIGCGLEDQGVHPEDKPEIREQALNMALNILVFAMNQ
ncbi:MAG: DUF4159 domain-containing protein [Candidatus Ozemobacteraceae bacterium]